MDDDIRDLFADDVFDPFEDEDDDQASELPNAHGGTSSASDNAQEGMVGDPLPPKEDKPKPELPAAERINNLFESMPSQKRLLLSLIAYCEEEKSGEQMDAYTLDLKENCYSVYSPVVLRELLEEAGAIRYIPAEDEVAQDASAENVAPIGSCDAAEEAFEQGLPGQVHGSLQEDDFSKKTAAADNSANAFDAFGNAFESSPLVDGGVLISIDESKVQHETLTEDGDELTLDYLEIEQPRLGLWVATAEGMAAVSAMDDYGATQKLLEKEPEYLDIYHQILSFCAEEPYGRSSKEIDALVNNSPLLQEPRRYSGYFVSRLEKQGALEWKSGWCVTEVGQRIIRESNDKMSEEACDE